MPYIYELPASTSFTGKGMSGYTFGPLHQDINVYYIEVEKGHDFFMISRKITRLYYVLSGAGHFIIDNHTYDVSPGVLVEIPPKVEYCYSGTMTLIAFATPRWVRGNDVFTKWNPDVVHRESASAEDGSRLARLARLRILGKSPVSAYLRLNRLLWSHLPSSATAIAPGRLHAKARRIWHSLPGFLCPTSLVKAYGKHLHAVVRLHSERSQSFGTFFLRNRAELELMRRLLDSKGHGATLDICVLACSKGAEVYSILWAIRSARPDLKVTLRAVDISQEILEFAERGVYSLASPDASSAPKSNDAAGKGSVDWNTSRDQIASIFERMTDAEVEAMFEIESDQARVRSWLKEDIIWLRGDAGDAEFIRSMGPQEIVVANRFLCHMTPRAAERCLGNIARLVKPGGYLFVSGIDLDVRSKIAQEMGWNPVTDLIKEIHDGDTSLRNGWPLEYWALEPFCDDRPDWKIRYASVFRVGEAADPGPSVAGEGTPNSVVLLDLVG